MIEAGPLSKAKEEEAEVKAGCSHLQVQHNALHVVGRGAATMLEDCDEG